MYKESVGSFATDLIPLLQGLNKAGSWDEYYHPTLNESPTK